MPLSNDLVRYADLQIAEPLTWYGDEETNVSALYFSEQGISITNFIYLVYEIVLVSV